MRRKLAPGCAEDWMLRAKSNLIFARQPKPEDVVWEDLCFQAHQAIVKALKAVYQKHGLVFKYVHDIEALAKGLEKGGIKVPSEVRFAVTLNRYAFEGRYPGTFEAATEEDLRKALVLAEAIVAWAEKIVTRIEEPGVSEKRAVYQVPKTVKKQTKTVKLR